MSVPHSLIVPDPHSKAPLLLISMGATLLGGLIIRALRQRHRRASSSKEEVVTSTGRTVRQPATSRTKARPPALLEATTQTSRTSVRVPKARVTVAPSER